MTSINTLNNKVSQVLESFFLKLVILTFFSLAVYAEIVRNEINSLIVNYYHQVVAIFH